MTNQLTFAELRAANIARQQEWDPGNKLAAGGAFRALELTGEIGELCEVALNLAITIGRTANMVKKLERERLGIAGSRVSLSDLIEELGDGQVCLDLLAMHYNVNLAAATCNKFNAVSFKLNLKTRL